MPGGSFAGLSDLVESLTGDVVFAMSRGSKELFHSDTLAWYVEHHPVLGEALLDTWLIPESGDGSGQVRVRREWRNLDLVVEYPGRSPLVIENKVFSLPDTDQLDSYADGKLHGLDRSVLVLLSLLDPGWPGQTWTTPAGTAWHWRGYDELCAALRPCLPELRGADRFGADVFERWLGLIGTLVDLSAEVGTPAPFFRTGSGRTPAHRGRHPAAPRAEGLDPHRLPVGDPPHGPGRTASGARRTLPGPRQRSRLPSAPSPQHCQRADRTDDHCGAGRT